MYKHSRVWTINKDWVTPLTKDIKLPKNIVVSTNGTFKVCSYPPRPFAEGQVLGSDGMLLSPDGNMEPASDHVGMLAGSTFSSVNAVNL